MCSIDLYRPNQQGQNVCMQKFDAEIGGADVSSTLGQDVIGLIT